MWVLGGKLWANRSRVQLIVWCLSWNRDLVFKEPYIFNKHAFDVSKGFAWCCFFWKMTLNFIFKWFELPFPCTIFAPQTTWVGRSFHREIPLQPVQNVRPVIPNGPPIFASMAWTPCCRSLWQKTILRFWMHGVVGCKGGRWVLLNLRYNISGCWSWHWVWRWQYAMHT